MRIFASTWIVACLALGVVAASDSSAAAQRHNILFITVDDMSCDSVGAFGCKLPDTTPHADRLAAGALCFDHAHVQVGNCMPSRNVMFSGRYPHNNGVEGFYQVRNPDYPVLADLMQAGGYFTGIRGKVSHSTPYTPYPAWDVVLDTLPDGSQAHPKNIESYYLSTQHGIALARQANKPFCLVINISDPHKPFYSEGRAGATVADPNVPSRVFTADEVPVPGFLFDDPEVREELAKYYSSVRRADDCLGATLRALQESGQADRTVVMFLSDHGMPLPFAKTQLYFHSTRTPWIVHWPGVTRPGTRDTTHMISGVDVLPTLLDIAGLPHPEGMDGRSFAPLLRGEKQAGRDMVITEYNENAGGNRHPMRSIVTREFGYIFNPWSNGERSMATATKGTVTYRRMRELAPSNAYIQSRLTLFDHRVPEEFYRYDTDSDALENLISSAAHRDELARLTGALEAWMERTADPLLEVFRNRHDPAAREAYMAQVEQEAAERRRPRNQPNAAPPAAQRRRNQNLIELTMPEAVVPGQPTTLKITHKLPKPLGRQQVHVTLKTADNARLERQVLEIAGQGELEVRFDVPADLSARGVRFAAFVGGDHPSNLQHVNSPVVPVR